MTDVRKATRAERRDRTGMSISGLLYSSGPDPETHTEGHEFAPVIEYVGMCGHCYEPEADHPVGWVPSRAVGDIWPLQRDGSTAPDAAPDAQPPTGYEVIEMPEGSTVAEPSAADIGRVASMIRDLPMRRKRKRRTRGGGLVVEVTEVLEGDAAFESAGGKMDRAARRRKARG